MNRRHFLTLTTATATTWPLARLTAAAPESSPMAAHRLAAVETKSVSLRWPRHAGRNAKLGPHGYGPTATAVILKTDQGASGWGEFSGNPKGLDTLRAAVVGRVVGDLFAPDRGIQQPEFKPLDFALHDLAGVILGQPVWKMLGAPSPHLYPVYSGMIYFDDLSPDDHPSGIDQVLKNCAVGGLGNGVTTEGVTCSHEHVDFGENVIRDGKQQLSTKPGFGLALR